MGNLEGNYGTGLDRQGLGKQCRSRSDCFKEQCLHCLLFHLHYSMVEPLSLSFRVCTAKIGCLKIEENYGKSKDSYQQRKKHYLDWRSRHVWKTFLCLAPGLTS